MAELLYWITLDYTGVLNEVAGWCICVSYISKVLMMW